VGVAIGVGVNGNDEVCPKVLCYLSAFFERHVFVFVASEFYIDPRMEPVEREGDLFADV